MIRCPTCDYAAVPGERCCPVCRNPFPGQSPAGRSDPPAALLATPQSSPALLIVGGLALALLAVALVLVLGRGESPPSARAKLGVDTPRAEVPSPPPATDSASNPALSNFDSDTIGRLLTGANEKLIRAKLLYDEGQAIGSTKLLNEAGFSAEDAERTYRVLADVCTGFRLEEVEDRLTQASQLLKIISDTKKAAVRPLPPVPGPVASAPADVSPLAVRAAPAPPPSEPAPAPAAAPAPVPAPRPPPFDTARPASGWAIAVDLFKEYVASPSSEKAGPVRSAALAAAGDARDVRPLLTAIAAILSDKDRQVWFARSDERKALEELLRKHDPSKFDGMAPDKLEEAIADIAAVTGLAKGEGEFLRLWGCAYLARLSMLGASSATLRKWLPKFGMVEERSGSEWCCGTPVGLAMNSLRDVPDLAETEKALKKLKVARDPQFATFAALTQLRLWDSIRDLRDKMAALPAIEKAFRTTRPLLEFADLFRHVAVTLRERMPCGTCQGTGSVDCEPCEEGRRLEECRLCRGTGKTGMFRGQQQPCRFCNGSGRNAMGGLCRDCRGTGSVACKPCGGKPWAPPAMAELVSLAPCELCGYRGTLFPPFHVACPACAGLGQIPSKP